MFNLLRQALTFRTGTSKYDSDEEDFNFLPPAEGYRRTKRTKDIHVVMNTNVQEPSRKEAVVANKHTGFPEPFSEDRNTTLPHPEADTSPNATIEAPDFDLSRTHSRGSIFERKRHLHHLWGKHDTPEKMGLYDNITYADEEVPAAPEEESEKVKGVDGVVEDGQRKKGVLKKLVLHK